jgi:hypothetical protein
LGNGEAKNIIGIMNVVELLKSDLINMLDNGDPLANEIKFNASYYIDFEKDVSELTDDEMYQIFGPLIKCHSKYRPYSYYEIVEIAKNLIVESLNYPSNL